MRLAVLFWCYKAPELCEDRLRTLRAEDPGVPLYVLFGGDPAEAEAWRARLAPLADDFYVFEDGPPPGAEALDERFRGGTRWKYYFGDLMFAAWYRDRGADLPWDTVAVVQWDMVLFGSVREVFRCLGPGEALFSGLRPIAEVEDAWAWTAPSQPAERERYLAFLAHLRERHGYAAEPQGYVAVVTCLPRAFLERFAAIDRPDLGFLEYRLPMWAQVFGTPLCTEHPFRPWWGAIEPFSPDHTLRARPVEISAWTMWQELHQPGGARLFHPYWRPRPTGFRGWARAIASSALRDR